MIHLIKNYAEANCTSYYSETAHTVLIHKKWFWWGCVTKSGENRVFKVLLVFKKLHKSIDFDIANHISIFERKLLFEFVWKTSNLKIKMSQLGSKSRSNTIIRKSKHYRKNREQYTRDNSDPVILFVPKHFPPPSICCTKPISTDNLLTFHKHISSKATGC